MVNISYTTFSTALRKYNWHFTNHIFGYIKIWQTSLQDTFSIALLQMKSELHPRDLYQHTEAEAKR